MLRFNLNSAGRDGFWGMREWVAVLATRTMRFGERTSREGEAPAEPRARRRLGGGLALPFAPRARRRLGGGASPSQNARRARGCFRKSPDGGDRLSAALSGGRRMMGAGLRLGGDGDLVALALGREADVGLSRSFEQFVDDAAVLLVLRFGRRRGSFF